MLVFNFHSNEIALRVIAFNVTGEVILFVRCIFARRAMSGQSWIACGVKFLQNLTSSLQFILIDRISLFRRVRVEIEPF